MGTEQEKWEAEADSVARIITLGWWLEKLAAPLIGASIVGACALLMARYQAPWGVTAAWWAIALFILAAALISLALAWKHREDRESILVRMDSGMSLNNALTSARAGKAPWPPMPPTVETGLRWNGKRIAIPFVAAFLFLLCGAFIPVTPPQDSSQTHQPQSWSALDSDLAKLSDDEAVDEPYIEEMEKRLEELREQAPEDWFSASSLEATDSLTEQHKNEISRVEQELNKLQNAMETMRNPSAGKEAKQRAQQDMQNALDSLKNGSMKPNSELMGQLRELDPTQLGQLSAEQMEKLREMMHKNADQLSQAQGGSGKSGDDWMHDLLDGEGDGDGEGEGKNGPPGNNRGAGGTNRSDGTDPDVFGQEQDRMRLKKFERLDMKDLENTLPGDLLELEDGEHSPNADPITPQGGGAIDSAGQGGDRVYKENLIPAEQRALKNFFSVED